MGKVCAMMHERPAEQKPWVLLGRTGCMVLTVRSDSKAFAGALV